ncbi:hypothetical protein MPRG_45540 [Mycobacterium paragordonae]|uniref:PE domain-containing protein n=1 Tax=Mycobacterium paragordonae TaxID=1389713 RepID=A0ABQ1C9Y3_9MYCO|nr:hypothetical protein MPRG_45540 [Mycobacterium paragordonae]
MPNIAAIAAEISSAPAAKTAEVGAAAAALAALIDEPILARSVAAAATQSVDAYTKDMRQDPPPN